MFTWIETLQVWKKNKCTTCSKQQSLTCFLLFVTSCVFCLISRMLNTKCLGRPPSLAHLDKVNSNSLDSCVTIQDLPPKVPPYSKLQDLAGSHTGTRLTPSPAPVLHIDSPSYASESLSLSGSPTLYPKLSSIHRSLESLPLQMSIPCSARFVPDPCDHDERGAGTWGGGTRTSLNLSDGQVLCIYRINQVMYMEKFTSRGTRHVWSHLIKKKCDLRKSVMFVNQLLVEKPADLSSN